MTTTEDSSGQSVSAWERCSQAGSQPASEGRVCRLHATRNRALRRTHHACRPPVSVPPFACCIHALATTKHITAHFFPPSVIASPLVHQKNKLFVRARESDWRRAHPHKPKNKTKKKTPDFALLTVHIKKKETAGACSHTPNPSRYSFPIEIHRERERGPKKKNKTNQNKTKNRNCLVLCVCVLATVFGILVGPFSGACVYPSGCRSTRRVGGGGGGGGEAGKCGMVFFFLRSWGVVSRISFGLLGYMRLSFLLCCCILSFFGIESLKLRYSFCFCCCCWMCCGRMNSLQIFLEACCIST